MGQKLMITIAIIAIVILGPYILTSIINGRQGNTSKLDGIDTGKDVIIQLDGENRLIDVEKYIAGVLPGLVDWRQNSDIIEAQAVAVRAKIYYAMGEDTIINASSLEYTYYTQDELNEKIGKDDKNKAIQTYEKAVLNTKGVIE